MINVKIVCIS